MRRALCLLLAVLCLWPWTIPARAAEGPVGSMELTYAQQFSVDYYPDGAALITIAGQDRYWLTPDGADAPADLDEDITVLRAPLDRVYLAASAAMDFFRQLNALDAVRLTSTTAANWTLPEVVKALDAGHMLYAGKYASPDYELVLSENADIAIESTMIWHSPETAEQLKALGVPVLVERSSYEPNPLGRMEWIKLYGLLTGHEAEAAAFFDDQMARLAPLLESAGENNSGGPTVAFFFINSNGAVNVRKPGDYISRLIEMAGGDYILESSGEDDNDLATMNMQMEAFYDAARDADILIYNSTIDAELATVDQLLQKSPLLADFKAVQTGDVWCMGRDMYQRATGLGALLADLYAVINGRGDETDLTFLHRLT